MDRRGFSKKPGILREGVGKRPGVCPGLRQDRGLLQLSFSRRRPISQRDNRRVEGGGGARFATGRELAGRSSGDGPHLFLPRQKLGRSGT